MPDHQDDDNHEGKESRKLSEVEMEKLNERLYYNRIEQIKNFETTRQKRLFKPNRGEPLTQAKEEELVKRIYDNQKQRDAAKESELEHKRSAGLAKELKFEQEDVDDQVQRMYYREMQKQEQTRKALEERFLTNAVKQKMSQDELQESVQRLYHVDWEARDEKLFQKLVYPFDPKLVKRSSAEIGEHAAKLHSTKGSY